MNHFFTLLTRTLAQLQFIKFLRWFIDLFFDIPHMISSTYCTSVQWWASVRKSGCVVKLAMQQHKITSLDSMGTSPRVRVRDIVFTSTGWCYWPAIGSQHGSGSECREETQCVVEPAAVHTGHGKSVSVTTGMFLAGSVVLLLLPPPVVTSASCSSHTLFPPVGASHSWLFTRCDFAHWKAVLVAVVVILSMNYCLS